MQLWKAFLKTSYQPKTLEQ